MKSANFFRRTFETPCKIEIEHSAESLHAHVALNDTFDMRPGDEVIVHDAPTYVPYGTRVVLDRTATVTRAGLLERLWTKLHGHFEVTELYEVSFTERRGL